MPRPRSDIQPRIVAAARRRFLAEGVDGASLREIARDAKTSLGLIVYYYPTKDDLFLAVVEEVYAKLVGELEEVLAAEGKALDRLRGGFVRLGTASDLELQVMRLMAREALSSSKRLRRILARFMRGHVPLIVATVADGIRNGELDGTLPLPLILVALMGLGVLPQIVRRATRGVPLFSALPGAEALAGMSVEMLSRVVGSGSGSRSPTDTRSGTRSPTRGRRS